MYMQGGGVTVFMVMVCVCVCVCGGGGGLDNTCHILKTRGCCLSLQANDDDEEEEVDRDVKRMGMWRWRIRGRGPKVPEINCKLSRGEKPFLSMILFDICVYHRHEH